MKTAHFVFLLVCFSCAPIESSQDTLLPHDASETPPPDAPRVACQEDTDCGSFSSECARGVCGAEKVCTTAPILEGDPCGVKEGCAAYSSCAYADECISGGSRSRTCTAYTCQSGSCLPSSSREEMDTTGCDRNADGQWCGEKVVCEDYSACSYDSTCDNDGSRTRTCYPFVCASGMCIKGTPFAETDTAGCIRNTDTSVCDTSVCEEYGACTYEKGTCDNSGIRYRKCQARVCQAGACAGATTIIESDTTGCARDTADTTCGDPTCAIWGACGYTHSCANWGTRSRTCTPMVCHAEACGPGTSSVEYDTMGCNINSNGITCGDTTCSEFGTCTYPDDCASDGRVSRTCSPQVCDSGRCVSGASYEDSQSCWRNSDGLSCGISQQCCERIGTKLVCYDQRGSCTSGACMDPEPCPAI